MGEATVGSRQRFIIMTSSTFDRAHAVPGGISGRTGRGKNVMGDEEMFAVVPQSPPHAFFPGDVAMAR
jgi:hypothetical protein